VVAIEVVVGGGGREIQEKDFEASALLDGRSRIASVTTYGPTACETVTGIRK
jgi:hypothetical protein